MRGLVRVQCEADDCGALLEVQLPEEGQSSSPFIIVRCGQCQRLLEVWLPSSSSSAAAPPARSPGAYTPPGAPSHQPSPYPKHAAHQPAAPRPAPASVEMQGLHSQCPQPEPSAMLHSRPGTSPAPPHYPGTGPPPAAAQQYHHPYYAHPPSSGASTHLQGWGAAAAGHNSSGSSTAAMYPASAGQQPPMHMGLSQHPSTAVAASPALPAHLASGAQAAAGYWSPASSTQQTRTPHRAGERSTPTGEGSGSGSGGGPGGGGGGGPGGGGMQQLPHLQPQGVQVPSDPTIQRDSLESCLLAADQDHADAAAQHSFHAAAQAHGPQQSVHPSPIDRWRTTTTPSWPAGMMHDDIQHHSAHQQVEHSAGASTDAHHGSNQQPAGSWGMPPATCGAVEHRLSVCMPQQGLTAQQATELLGSFEGSSWTPQMGALTALLLGDADDDDMLLGLERLLSGSWNDIEADQLLGQAASIAAAGEQPSTPTAAAAAAGGSQALMHSLPPGVKLQPMRKQRKRKNGASPSPGPLNPYSEFMRAEMRRLREVHPGLNHRVALRMAATNWASARPVLGAVFPSIAGASQISTPAVPASTPASTAHILPAGTTAPAASPGPVGTTSTQAVDDAMACSPAAATPVLTACVDVAAAAGPVPVAAPATNGGSSTASSGTGWTAAALIPTVLVTPEADSAAASTPAVAFVSGAGQRGTPLHSLNHLRQVLSDLLAQSQTAANADVAAAFQQQPFAHPAAEAGASQIPSQSFTLRSMSNDVSMDAPLSSLAGVEAVSSMED